VARTFNIIAWAVTVVLAVMGTIGLPGLAALMAVESFGIPPFSGELILAFGGVLIVEGTPYFNWGTVVAAGVLGSLAGAWSAYELARWAGPRALHRWGKKIGIAEHEIDTAHRFFERRGEATVFVARLLPVVRGYISYPAGTAGMDRAKFVAYSTLGILPFTLFFVYLGVVFGQNYLQISHYFGYAEVAVVLALVVLVVWWVYSRRANRQRIAAAGGQPGPGGAQGE
jgi:membrane protein DedA with SNARE-associated domain